MTDARTREDSVQHQTMQAVMQAETTLGNHPRDVSKNNEGYDIESLILRSQAKGRRGAWVNWNL